MSLTPAETEILDKIEKEGHDALAELHGCARCALMAVADHIDVADKESIDTALRAGITLSGGIAGTRHHCGALIGGIMAIGIAGISDSPRVANNEQKATATKAARAFYRRFEREMGNVYCRDLREIGLGRQFDTDDPDEVEKYKAAGGVEMCCNLVGKGARMAAETILEMRRESA